MKYSILYTVCILACSVSWALPCPVLPSWPTTDWQAMPTSKNTQALDAYAFTLQGSDKSRKGIRTDAVVIVQNGVVIYERYARGFTAWMPHKTWSVSKSVINALTGIAVHNGWLQLNDTLCNYIDAPSISHCDILVQHVLEFATGLDWNEGYEGTPYTESSVLAMLFGEGRHNMAHFALSHPKRSPPGETFDYSSGDAHVMSAIVHSVITAHHNAYYPWALLFNVLGMNSAVFERDGQGVFVGSSHFYATPRDMAKLGFLYLQDGCWNNTRILPEQWVQQSTQVSAPYRTHPLHVSNTGRQGWHFWLNRAVPEQNLDLPWPDVPNDAFAARGHWGQSITVIPSKNMVIVRTADDRDEPAFDFNHFLKLAMALGD
jgi:CubicO group peptidase (beta-lactamase class C family)